MSRLVLAARISLGCQIAAALALLGVVLATGRPLHWITDVVLLVAFAGNSVLLGWGPVTRRREPPPPEVVTLDRWPAHP